MGHCHTDWLCQKTIVVVLYDKLALSEGTPVTLYDKICIVRGNLYNKIGIF